MADAARAVAGFAAIVAALVAGSVGWWLAYGDTALRSHRTARELAGVLLVVAALAGVLAALGGLWGADPGA